MALNPRPDPSLTTVANESASGNLTLLHQLVENHYVEMKDVARRIAAREPNAAPNPTELVHEAFIRLVDRTTVTARGTTFFVGCFARQCRRILVDHARARRAKHRGGDIPHERISSVHGADDRHEFDLLDLNDAIEVLIRMNERMGRIVEMRVFGGLGVQDCAEVLGVSTRTVDTDWAFARTWMRKQLRL